MFKVTIELPEKAVLFTTDDKQDMAINFKAMDDSGKLVPFLSGKSGALVRALRIPLMNAYNSPGASGTPAEKLAAAKKRRDSWERGDWAIVERGESEHTAMREAWIDDFRLQTGATQKEAESHIRATVVEAYGKDSKATFGNFIDATAQSHVDNGDFDNLADARDAVESALKLLVEAAAKRREEAAKKAIVPTLDLSAFKKKAK